MKQYEKWRDVDMGLPLLRRTVPYFAGTIIFLDSKGRPAVEGNPQLSAMWGLDSDFCRFYDIDPALVRRVELRLDYGCSGSAEMDVYLVPPGTKTAEDIQEGHRAFEERLVQNGGGFEEGPGQDTIGCEQCGDTFPPDHVEHCQCGRDYCARCFDAHAMVCEELLGEGDGDEEA